jgi:xanthine dehydrogenase accessory factor
MISYVLIWGGGDLASGVAFRLHRAGVRVLVVEQAQPCVVRRSVAFADAVYVGKTMIEDLTGRLIDTPDEMAAEWEKGNIPVLIDPKLQVIKTYRPLVLIDARMQKEFKPLSLDSAPLVVGLGPGFIANENCHAAIETNRGHFLGRVYWEGSPQADTGIPGVVQSYGVERVLYAPMDGTVKAEVSIGDVVNTGDPIMSVTGEVVRAPFAGLVRGLIHDGLQVQKDMKVGDVDPRMESFRCLLVSEKSLAIGGGVLEAVLTRKAIRTYLWKT